MLKNIDLYKNIKKIREIPRNGPKRMWSAYASAHMLENLEMPQNPTY